MKRIAIIGLGLIGGSVAKAVRRNSDIDIIGWNRSRESLTEALHQNIINGIWDKKSVLEAALVLLATPPAATIDFLKENASYFKPGTVITDVCGVKTSIVKECEPICKENGLYFLGGHPMAGKEKGGFLNSDESLFEGASYIITPTEQTKKIAIERVTKLAKIIGAREISVTTPEEHDRIIAFTSQLPHVLAGAYVKSPACLERKGFSAGSFMDVSRVATADEKLWTELFSLNAENLCAEIDTLIKNLAAYRDAIKNNDSKTLAALINEGCEIKTRDN